MNHEEIAAQVKLANSNKPQDRDQHAAWLTINAHRVFADYVKVLAKLEQLAQIVKGEK